MAKTRHQRKKAAKPPRDDVTPERARHNELESAGMARRVIPTILLLKNRGDLNEREYEVLDYYRQQASLADRSPSRDSCDFSVRGGSGGFGPSVAILSAKRETQRLEGLLGALRHICRAVCVEDMSLTQWACHKYGSVEVFKKNRKTGKLHYPLKVVGVVPRGKLNGQVHIIMERMNLRVAAKLLIANPCKK